MEATLDNLKVHGDGSFLGGVYNNIKIHGAANFSGDTSANTITATGSCTTNGDLHCKTILSIHGKYDINGNVTSKLMKLNGACDITGDAHIETSKNKGRLSIEKNFSGEQLFNKGDLIVHGNVNFETFVSDGRFRINGLLNAGEINIIPTFLTSTVKEIGGESITIRLRKSIASILPFISRGRVEAELIEGDTIYLENTHAKVVRGHNIEIGPNCVIDTIECSGKYILSADSTVHERI